jgi:sugar phosphate isomerase/epimerase
VHLKDHVGTQSVNIGDGEIDLKGIFAELMNNNYEGSLALEIEPEDTENLPIYVGRSYNHITGLLDELGAIYE